VTAKSKIKANVAVVCNVGSIAVENGCSVRRVANKRAGRTSLCSLQQVKSDVAGILFRARHRIG